MTIAKGTLAPTVRLLEVSPLSREDLEVLRAPRHNLSIAERFRDPHHNVARLLALGMKQKDVAAATGYSANRISQLEASPAFQELLALYRQQVAEKFTENADELVRAMTSIQRKAIRTVEEHFDAADEEGELIPLKTALAVAADMADRLGPAKRSVSTNTNINVDFAAELEKAIARSGRTIEGTVVSPSPVGAVASDPTDSRVEPPASGAPRESSSRRRIA